jgi:hypothetical protein
MPRKGHRVKPHSKVDAACARKIGVSPKFVRLRGGVAKLHTLAPEAAKVLLRDHEYGNSQSVHKGGLRKRGFKYAQRQDTMDRNSAYERLVDAMLRERGLVKE